MKDYQWELIKSFMVIMLVVALEVLHRSSPFYDKARNLINDIKSDA